MNGKMTNRQAFARCSLEYALAVWAYDKSYDWSYLEFGYWLDDDYQHVGKSPRKLARELIDKQKNCTQGRFCLEKEGK